MWRRSCEVDVEISTEKWESVWISSIRCATTDNEVQNSSYASSIDTNGIYRLYICK